MIQRFLRWRHARAVLQAPLLLLALVMVWDGLTGPQAAPKNLATVATWLHYRGFLVLGLLVAGNLFCMACPFMLPRNLARRWLRPTRSWPSLLRNKWLAAGVLALYLFVYELFDLWASPFWTAVLILGYFVAALAVDSVFRGAPFCKHVCPLGQFNFLASMLSPLEVRVKDRAACGGCATKDCISGPRGCELGLFQERKVGNLDCTFCLDCVQACPVDNVTIAPRLVGPELWSTGWRSGVGRLAQRPDLSVLAAVFTFGALLNAFAMVSPVYALSEWLAGVLGTRSETAVLGTLFLAFLVVEPVALLSLAGLATRSSEPLLQTITRFSYALVPVGVAVWLAHYLFHFVTGFWSFVPVLQALAGSPSPDWTLAGAPAAEWLLPLELGFLFLGFLVSAVAAGQIARSARLPATAALPWQALALILTAAAVWLMNQPMEMRGTLLGG